VDKRVLLRSGGTRRFQPVGIAFGIAEAQRVFLDVRRWQHFMPAFVEDLRESRLGPDAIMMFAAWAAIEILFPFLGEYHRLAFAAFVPEVVGALPLRKKGNAAANPAKPAHVMSSKCCAGAVTPTAAS